MIETRKATLSDVPGIMSLINDNLDSLLPRTAEELESLIETICVAFEYDKLVGCAILEVYSQKIAEVRSVAVAADMRGRGIGKMVIQAVVAEAKRRKILEVFAVTSRLEFFKSVNFEPCLNNEKFAVFWNGKE